MLVLVALLVLGSVLLDNSCRAAKDIGCLSYTEEIRQNIGLTQNFPEGLTNGKCNKLCFENGYTYAATRNGSECLCIKFEDNQDRPRIRIPAKNICDIPCDGDPLQKCGGNRVISVYQTIDSNRLAVGKSLGCFNDDNNTQRILIGRKFELNSTNSPQKCLNMCRELKFKFSGVRNSYECYCGNEFNIPAGESSTNLGVDESECHMPCTGDPTQNCGEKSKIYIYRTGDPDKIPPVGFAGCFSIQDNFKSDYMENMGNYTTAVRCMSRCFQLGHNYAGIKLGAECHCINIPDGLESVDASRCNLECPGDLVKNSGRCGGADTISGYSLGIPSLNGQRMGCFQDQLTYPIIDGYKTDLISTNSPIKCNSICFTLGFVYAGVRDGYKCLCGSSAPMNPKLLSDLACNINCPADKQQKCGGFQSIVIYKTGFDASTSEYGNADKCIKSITKVNGVNVCKSAVIFKDTFTSDSLDKSKWQHSIRFSGDEEYEFVVYTADSEHISVSNSKLKITPTLIPDEMVRNGEWKLSGCTGNPGTDQCERKAIAYNIIPPIQSSNINTKHAFSFQYGIVNVRAKVPVGDWISPQFYLRSKTDHYGPSYKSGIIRIGTVKGNKKLMCGKEELGQNHIEHGVILGSGNKVKGRTIKRSSNKYWNYKFHNYTVYWGPDKISFLVDNIQEIELLPDSNSVLSEIVGFTSEEAKIWKDGSKIAPFDQEFYISIGVSVGGLKEFDDDCISNGHPKPWRNGEVKSVLKFWQDRSNWHSTWSEKSLLEVESVVVTAL